MVNLKNYNACVCDILGNDNVLSMKDIKQHTSINCLEHSLFVSYMSFRICRFLRWDYTAAARGGLLHDLFLYNQFIKSSHEGFHLRTHPKAALANADRICELSELEKDIILKHMWPITFKLPKYKESFVVNITDTLCAVIEMLSIYKRLRVRAQLRSLLPVI